MKAAGATGPSIIRSADGKNTAPGLIPAGSNGVSTTFDEDLFMASLLTGLAAAPVVNNPLASTTLDPASPDTKVKVKAKVDTKVSRR